MNFSKMCLLIGAMLGCLPLVGAEDTARLMRSQQLYAKLIGMRAEFLSSQQNNYLALENAKSVFEAVKERVQSCPADSYLAVQLQPQLSAAAEKVAHLAQVAERSSTSMLNNLEHAQQAFERSLQGPSLLERLWSTCKDGMSYVGTQIKPWINTPVGGIITGLCAGTIIYKLWQWKRGVQSAPAPQRPQNPGNARNGGRSLVPAQSARNGNRRVVITDTQSGRSIRATIRDEA